MPTVFKDGIISKGGVNQGVPVGNTNPTQASQSRNSKTPQQAISDLAGSNISFGQSVVQNGFKQTRRCFFKRCIWFDEFNTWQRHSS